MKNLCIVEPDLNSYMGHMFNYCRSIYSAARRDNINVRVFGSKEYKIETTVGMPVEGIFDSFLAGKMLPSRIKGYFLRPFQCNRSFYNGMVSPKTGFLNQDWVVFVCSATTHNLLGLYFWLKRYEREKAPTLVLFMRFSCSRNGRPGISLILLALWKFLLIPVVKKLSRKYQIRLVTDSQKLAGEYRSFTGLPVSVLPIPHTSYLKTGRACHGDKIVFLNPGGARSDKGFSLLASAIRLLHQRNQLTGIDFLLHCYSFKNDKGSLRSIALLKSLGLPNVKLIEHTVDEMVYQKMIGNSDIIVLPYLKWRYSSSTSGILAEALALGKPVVATDGTWMSDQLKDSGAGVCFKDNNVEDLARAMLEAKNIYPQLAKQAEDFRSKWAAFHNPDNFIRELANTAN